MSEGNITPGVTGGLVRRLEQAGLNGVPAQRTLFDRGWVVRISDGGLKRVNSVTCLDPGDTAEIAARIERTEVLYRRFSLPCTFRLTPLAPPPLDEALDARGYRVIDETVVMRLELTPPLRPAKDDFAAAPLPGWFEVLAADVPPARHQALQRTIDLLALPSFYPLFRHEGTPASCARVTLEHDLAGVFEVETIPTARRAGLARQMMFEALAAAASRGAALAWLQVSGANNPAIALYRSLGFTEAYRYRYRVQK